MMEDRLLQERCLRHLEKLIELSRKEQQRNAGDGHFRWLAEQYEKFFAQCLETFTSSDCRISQIFKMLSDMGSLELITTAATHGILPLLKAQPKAMKAQVETGLDYFEKVFGFRAQGMWLPECGYAPGIDDLLREQCVRYFVTESVAVDHASIAPLYGVCAPIYTPQGVAAFARDPGCTEQVWSSRKGYPGDPLYREFYRDIGFDLDFNYIRPYLAGDVRSDTGIKYYRITGATAHKQAYDPHHARERAAAHAGDFMHKRMGQINHVASRMKTPPVVVAPFDAELFGHWWFEGPQWLDYVVRKVAYDQDVFELTTPGAYLDAHPVHQTAVPCTSTWGRRATFETWVNGKVDWIYPHLSSCGRRMEELASRFVSKEPPALLRRALNQCVRELLLAQSSDWPFIIAGGTAEQYATRRVRDHVSRFHCLADAIEKGEIPERELQAIEEIDRIFPDADFRVFG
jgi:1,4-alpha-glucan branching enzyme